MNVKNVGLGLSQKKVVSKLIDTKCLTLKSGTNFKKRGTKV